MTDLRPPERFITERLQLRPLGQGDARNVFEGYSSCPEATRFMPFPRQTALAEAEAFVARCAACWGDGSAFPWAVEARDSGEFLGVIELGLAPPKAHFGYIYRRSAWGRGVATEAARTVVAWVLAQPALHRIWATCHPDNTPSARVLAAAGLEEEAVLACWEARPQLGEAAGPARIFAKVRPTA
jgi:[ribosomal protein S5]-alanine N-acetyltransferase